MSPCRPCSFIFGEQGVVSRMSDERRMANDEQLCARRTDIGLRFSGLAYDRPGWGLVSTHDNDLTTFFAVELRVGRQYLFQ